MALLSDTSIKARCSNPTHIRVGGGIPDTARWVFEGLTHSSEEIRRLLALRALRAVAADDLGLYGWTPMISPFVPEARREDEAGNRIVSYGLSAAGYDVRLANKFKIFTNTFNARLDPLAMDGQCYVDAEGDYAIIPPNSYILGHTVESFNIPRDIMATCIGKSTYARLGAIVNVTPIEPGFIGQVVIEISNATTLPLKVYANHGIAQFLFHQLDQPCAVSYADKGGKYQGQQGLQTALL